jgi:hypothetical protein
MGRPTKNRKQTSQSRPRPLMVAYPVHARLHLHRVWSRCRAWPWSAGGKASSQMVHSMVTLRHWSDKVDCLDWPFFALATNMQDNRIPTYKRTSFFQHAAK